MKHLIKHISCSFAVMAMLASCSQSNEPTLELSADKYIIFDRPWIDLDASIGGFDDNAATRASLVTSIDRFQVWGFCVPNNISGNLDASGAEREWNRKSTDFTGTADGGADLQYLADRQVDTSTAANYNDGQLCQWNDTEGALHSFIAIAPGSASYSMTKASMSNKKGPQLTITLNRNATAGVNTPLDRTEQPDVLVGTKFDHRKRDGQAVLSFFHIMTALKFKFHNYSDHDLIIKSMTFKGNFHRRAIVDFTTDEPVVTIPDASDVSANSYAGTFTIIPARTGSGWQTISHGSEDFAGGDSPAIILLLPNPAGTIDNDNKFVLGSNKSFDIVYRFADDSADAPDRTFTTPDDFTLNYLPQPNTLHTAHFNFIGDNFVITFQADDTKNWENGSDNNFTIK